MRLGLVPFAHRAGELFVEIYRGLEQRPVAPAVERGALAERFAGTLGDDGDSLERAHLFQEMGRLAFRAGDNASAIAWAERALAAGARVALAP